MKATSHRAGGGFAALASHRLLWPAATLVLLCLLNWYFNPGFFHIELKSGHLYGSVIDILNRAAPLMLVAMGMTIVIAMRGIDISVGAVVAISGAVAASLIGGTLVIQNGAPVYVSNVPMSLAILGALGTALLCGVWNGVLVAGPGMQPIIATLILMVAGRGIAQLITGGQIITIYYEPFFFIGNGFLFGLPFSLYLVAAVFVVLLLAVKRTALGLFIQAVGINPVAARFAGLNARTLLFGAYAFCGFVGGIAGLIIDGAVRDSDSILEMGFPVFSRGLSIRAAQKNQPGRINVPIICGGVAINPGDWVMGDRDGVVVIPRLNVSAVIVAAKAREAAEIALRKGIEAGKSTVELLGLEPSLRRVGLGRR